MRVLFIIPQTKFKDSELFVPKKFLESKKITCEIASKHKGMCQSIEGELVEANFSLREVDNGYDALIFIGGSGASAYFNDAEALGLAVKYNELGRVIGAICIAPTILANAGILSGKKVTSFASEEERIKSKGANYVGGHIQTDGRIVTASGPLAARIFAEAVFEAIKSNKQ